MSQTLKQRIDAYQELSDYKIMNRVPLITVINGRAFSKLTSLIEKPYCIKFAEGMLSATLKLCMEIEGALFAYQFNDEIVIVSRNDQTLETEPWYDNRVQKIASITASLATLHFKNYLGGSELELIGDPLFTSHVFPVPTIGEAINAIICKQQENLYKTIQFTCFYSLLKKYDKNTVKEMLTGLAADEKIALLHQECGINFNKDLPLSFRRGVACYKVPQIMDGEVVKSKWNLNTELPIFVKDQGFLNNLFKNGIDLFRKENIIF